jgi:hypothetical protein
MSSRSRKKTGRSDKEARHVRLYHSMLKSSAWKSLTANARAIYIEMASRYGGPGSNNGRIPYSVRDAAKSLTYRTGSRIARSISITWPRCPMKTQTSSLNSRRQAIRFRASHSTETIATIRRGSLP